MSVSTSRILDVIAAGCQAYHAAGTEGIARAFGFFNEREVLAFDLFLVRMGDDLAHMSESPLERFTARVKRMVEA